MAIDLIVWKRQVQPRSNVSNVICGFLVPFLSRTRFTAKKLFETPYLLLSFLVALGSELLQFPPLVCVWLLAVPAKATFSAMQSLADPAKAACAGSGEGKSKWMRLSGKWTAQFLLDPASPETGSWVQEQEQPWARSSLSWFLSRPCFQNSR